MSKKVDYNQALSVSDLSGNLKEVYPDNRKDIEPRRSKKRRFRKIRTLYKNQRKK